MSPKQLENSSHTCLGAFYGFPKGPEELVPIYSPCAQEGKAWLVLFHVK